jgi:hypothetical protein
MQTARLLAVELVWRGPFSAQFPPLSWLKAQDLSCPQRLRMSVAQALPTPKALQKQSVPFRSKPTALAMLM